MLSRIPSCVSIFTVSLGTYALTAHAEPEPVVPGSIGIETLYGYVTTNSTLVAQVYSGGCTNDESFLVKVTQARCLPTFPTEDNKHCELPRVTLLRIKPDYCRGFFRHGTLVNIDLSEQPGLGNGPFVLTNPVEHPLVINQAE